MPVVPYVGTWIEIASLRFPSLSCSVVPYVGTWIEIISSIIHFDMAIVVPYVGTWIEISFSVTQGCLLACRSLRGNVDRNFYGVLDTIES